MVSVLVRFVSLLVVELGIMCIVSCVWLWFILFVCMSMKLLLCLVSWLCICFIVM